MLYNISSHSQKYKTNNSLYVVDSTKLSTRSYDVLT